jgi:hypothetical protein
MEKTTEEIIIALECSLLRPEVRASADAVAHLLAEDFIEFGSSGRIFDKKTTVAALAAEAPTEDGSPVEACDFSVRVLAAGVVMVTYRSILVPTAAQSGRQALRSSIWTFTGNRWQMLFHQGTVMPDRGT